MATLKIKKEDGTWAFVETAEAVKYTEQILTNEQKIQAKNNIGVTEDLTALKSYIDNKPVTKSDTIKDSDTESTYMTIHYAGDGLENADWVAAWNPDDPTQIKAIAPSKLLKGYVPKEAVLASGTDLNTVLESGFYRLSDSHVNVPDNLDCNYGNMIVSRGADTALQIVTPYSGAARLCYRSGVVKNGAFVNVTNWRYILDNETYSYLNNITGVITSTSSLVESWQDHDDYIATIGAISNFIDNKLTCLAEGTPINMYDGTYKNIEDVKTGDIVLSYNPVTKE